MLASLIGAGAGAGLGALGGWLDSRRTGGTDKGNALSTTDAQKQAINASLDKALAYQVSPDAMGVPGTRTATGEVQNNPILSQLFGQGGALERANAEEQNLASRGFSLQPQDFEAYGQGMGNIAREFDSAEGNLAQALANRGLSNSGVANQAFMSSQGNKLEQLGQLQRQIANDRMRSNMERLSQTRNFLSNMGSQAQGAIQDQFGRQQSGEQMQRDTLFNQARLGQSRLEAEQGQANEQLDQRLRTQEKPAWAQAASGGLAGAMSGARMGGALK